jgi:tight adherence protein B
MLTNISLKDLWHAAVLSIVLVAIILLVMAVYQFLIEPTRKRRKISRRLSEGYEKRLQLIEILKDKPTESRGWWPKLLKNLLGEKRLATLKSRMLQADVREAPEKFLLRSFLLGLLVLVAGTWALDNPLFGVLLAGGFATIPFFYLTWRRTNKTRKFEAQMPDGMELLARSLRVGHALPSAIELLGEEMEDPMGTEMMVVYEEQQFGISTSDALLHLLERVESMDLRYFVAAVMIQQETGGNLAELMDNIATVIRSRLNFKSKVKGLTAMGRISTTIMVIAPLLAFLGLMVVAPEYEKKLIYSSLGRMMLMAGVTFVLIGSYLLKKVLQAVET